MLSCDKISRPKKELQWEMEIQFSELIESVEFVELALNGGRCLTLQTLQLTELIELFIEENDLCYSQIKNGSSLLRSLMP